MAKYSSSVVSATAAIDWHDLFATGGVLNGKDVSEVVVRLGSAGRIAAGVVNPGTSGTAGTAAAADQAITVSFEDGATNKTLWVQSPASRAPLPVAADVVAEGKLIIVTA